MESDESSPIRYRFETPVDILITLDTQGIEHLEVSDERTIIIYNRSILNLQVADGQLNDARTILVEIFDPSAAARADQMGFIETFVEKLATAAAVDWERR